MMKQGFAHSLLALPGGRCSQHVGFRPWHGLEAVSSVLLLIELLAGMIVVVAGATAAAAAAIF